MSKARIVYDENKLSESVNREITARRMIELMLPLVEGLEPFVALTEDDLGDAPEHTPCWGMKHQEASFRVVRREDLEDVGLTIPEITQRAIAKVRLALKGLGLDRGRVVWHAAECKACRTFRLRPAVAVRIGLGGGVSVEREYGIAKAQP